MGVRFQGSYYHRIFTTEQGLNMPNDKVMNRSGSPNVPYMNVAASGSLDVVRTLLGRRSPILGGQKMRKSDHGVRANTVGSAFQGVSPRQVRDDEV